MKKIFLYLLLPLLVFILGFTAVLYTFFPIAFNDVKQRFELLRAGAVSTQFQEMSGIERNFCQKGEATCTCVLLIHGLGDGALTWRKILQAPAATWKKPVHFTAFDLPGSGISRRPDDLSAYRVRNQAKLLSAWADSTSGCTELLAVGNSLGGWIATWLAIEGSPKITKFALLGPAGFKGAPLPKLNLLNGSVEALKEFQRRAYYKPHELSDSVWKAAAARAVNGNSKQVSEAQTPDDDVDSKLASITRPVAFIEGEADQIIPPDYAQAYAKAVHGATYHSIPKCGHLPQKECPVPLEHLLNDEL